MVDENDTVTLHDSASFVGTERACALLSHRQGVELLVLLPDEERVIGREAPADVVIADPSLSRAHARLSFRDGTLRIEDLGSKNGTQVNGARIEALEAIGPGDDVQLGKVHLAVQDSAHGHQGLDGHDAFVEKLEAQSVRARLRRHHLTLLLLRPLESGLPLGSWVPALRLRLERTLATPFGLGLYGPGRLQIWIAEAAPETLAALGSAIVGPIAEVALIGGGSSRFGAASNIDELYVGAQAALRRAAANGGLRWTPLREHPGAKTGAGDTVFEATSAKMQEVYRAVDRLSRSTIPVLLQGETGTGKEVIARAIHDRGPRRQKPMRCINCGAIPESLLESALFGHEKGAFTGADSPRKGVFEEADQGTVLLDEVGELSLSAQVALLRVLEGKRVTRVGSSKEIPVDVRVIAATHRDLEAMCKEDSFRLDLLYRLNAMTVELPPLRQRLEDVAELAQFFLDQAREREEGSALTIAADAVACFERYDWPGNLRELRNVITRALIIASGERIEADDLPARIRQPSQSAASSEALAFKERIQRYETELILEALKETNYNQSEAARRLHMPLRSMVRKIQAYGLGRKG